MNIRYTISTVWSCHIPVHCPAGRPDIRRRVFTSDTFYSSDPTYFTWPLAHPAKSTAARPLPPPPPPPPYCQTQPTEKRLHFASSGAGRLRPCRSFLPFLPSYARAIADIFKKKFARNERPLTAATRTLDGHGVSREYRRYVSVALPADLVCSLALYRCGRRDQSGDRRSCDAVCNCTSVMSVGHTPTRSLYTVPAGVYRAPNIHECSSTLFVDTKSAR